jgi:hypothetical protein
MSDTKFAKSPVDPLPDRLKQYLSDTARREIDELRAALDSRLLALEAALAHPEPHDSLEALVIDLARVATAEAEASAAKASLEAELESKSRASASAELQRLLDAERAATTALRAEIDEVRKKLEGDLSRERAAGKTAAQKFTAAQRELAEARRLMEERSRALEAANGAAASAQQGASARVATAESAKTQADRAAQQAEARLREADQRRHEADVRASDADTRQKDAEARQKEAEARQKEAEARAEESDSRRRQTEMRAGDAETLCRAAEARAGQSDARANESARAVEALTAEIAAAKQAAEREREASNTRQASHAAQVDDLRQRLAASAERVRALELQLFKRDRPLQDRDEGLSAMLARDLAVKSRRRASRYNFAGAIDIEFGGEAGVLVDLSIAGAQVLSSRPLEQGREATLTLISQEVPVSGDGRVVWSQLDADSHAQRFRYRAGILFTAVDAASVEAFIIRYSAT